MAVFDNINLSTSSGVATAVVDYHERNLLPNMKPKLVHMRDMQIKPLPLHNGRRIQFRKMVPFAPITEPLQEGVTPAGQTVSQTALWATVKPYGNFAPLSDEFNQYLIDDMQRELNQMLADQAALTIDNIARDAMHSGTNVQYSGGKTSRAALTASDILTYNDIKKAVRTLKKANCEPFDDGFYHAVVDPDTINDLTNDTAWHDVATYQDKSKIEKNELGIVYKVKFFESTNAKVFTSQTYIYGTVASLAITAGSWDASSRTLKVPAMTDYAARQLVGLFVNIKGSDNALTPMCIEDVNKDGTVTLRWAPASAITANWATGATIVPTGGGASGAEVHSTIVYGKDFAGCVSLEGNGHNVGIIIKPLGSSGAEDPLNQRGTIAWKVKGFCATILQDAFGVRIEHGVSA